MRIIYVLFAITFQVVLLGQANDGSLKHPLNYFLPDIQYNEAITTPEAFLGHQVGEWHVSHDKLVEYMKLLAAQSDRIEWVEYGRTHENRPLLNLYISSPANLARKEQIRKMSHDLTDGELGKQTDLGRLPLILYQGYTIHGNEPSGVNASILVAYYLAAGESEEVKKTLDQCFIVFDPCYNPDGMQRFSTWANSHKGKNLITDPATREYNEMWPGGRTNHYWFDLNRDWLLLVHPESRARVAQFHHWKPNVLTDHHEMGTNSTFFFQPGVPSRTNPLTPKRNQELTEMIATYHSRALDSIGSLYYSKESFDDFYYGKGSTYPDIHGAVGILFEQASSRGHLQESVNGLLSFPFTIRNQVVTSLSTQRACVRLKKELQEFKKQYYADRITEMQKESVQGYLFTDADQHKAAQLVNLLHQHQVEVYELDKDHTAGPTRYKKGSSYLVPVQQTQGRLVKTMFEKVVSFKDSIFYDVSTWTLPLAFDVMYTDLNKETTQQLLQGAKKTNHPYTFKGECNCDEKSYALIAEWQQANSAAFLYDLLKDDIKVRITTQKLSFEGKSGPLSLGEGSLIIPLSGQNKTAAQLTSYVRDAATRWQMRVGSMHQGAVEGGFSPGHPDVQIADIPKVITIIGQGVSSYDAGELWHFMDQRLGMPITLADKKDLGRVDFERYNTLILVDGSYSDLTEAQVKKIEEFVKKGGSLIAMGKALDFVKAKSLAKITVQEADKPKQEAMPYALADDVMGSRVLGGAIFNATADLTHPLCFGLGDDQLALFKQGTEIYKLPENAFAAPLRYASQKPLLTGYTPRGFEDKLKSTAAAGVYGLGNGTVFCFPDNLLFRGYWWGGFRIFSNALFFGHMIDRSSIEK